MTRDEAAGVISDAAGWKIPADWADPFVVDVAYAAALELGADGERFNEAARTLGLVR